MLWKGDGLLGKVGLCERVPCWTRHTSGVSFALPSFWNQQWRGSNGSLWKLMKAPNGSNGST